VSTTPTPTPLDQALAAVESAEATLNSDLLTLSNAQSALTQLQQQQATDLANFQAAQAAALQAAQTNVANTQSSVNTDVVTYKNAVNAAIAALQASESGLPSGS